MKKIIYILIVIFIILLISTIYTYTNKHKKDYILDGDGMIEKKEIEEIIIEVNNKELIAKLENNSSAKALVEKLKEKSITINAHDYGNFEKVGELGFNLPTNDVNITTTPGDIILYQGNQITIYYDTNTWNFTKLGKIENITKEELKDILGDKDVTIILKIKES